MHNAAFLFSLVLGTAAGVIPFDFRGGAIGVGGSVAAKERTKSIAMPLEETGVGYAPSFASPLFGASYGNVSAVPNPYVPSGYRASADYNYLYTQASTYGSAPSVASYRYAPDRRFLFSPSSGADVVASAYRWNYAAACQGPAKASANDRPGIALGPAGSADPRPARSFAGPGRKESAVGALKAAHGMLTEDNGQWQLSPALKGLKLAEAVRRGSHSEFDLRYFCRERNP